MMRDRERKQKTRKERRYRVSQGKEGKKMEKAGRRCIGCWEPVSSGRMGNGAEDRMDFQALRICESIVMMVVGRVRRLRVRRWGRRGITVDAGVTTTRASGARAPQLDIDGRGAWNEAVSSGRTAFAGVGEGVGEGRILVCYGAATATTKRAVSSALENRNNSSPPPCFLQRNMSF